MKCKIKILIIFLIIFSPLFSIAEIYPDYEMHPTVELLELEREFDKLLFKSKVELLKLIKNSISQLPFTILCKKENNIKYCETYLEFLKKVHKNRKKLLQYLNQAIEISKKIETIIQIGKESEKLIMEIEEQIQNITLSIKKNEEQIEAEENFLLELKKRLPPTDEQIEV